jgi:hypothetical protein
VARLKVSTRIDPIDRDIELITREWLSPESQQRLFAQFAQEQFEEVENKNADILGRRPRSKITVDGKAGGSIARAVQEVLVEFELVSDALQWIGEQLVLTSIRRWP